MSCGFYVHVPFCRKRCPYCAFVLIESDGALHARFVDKVCREIRSAARPAPSTYGRRGCATAGGVGSVG